MITLVDLGDFPMSSQMPIRFPPGWGVAGRNKRGAIGVP